MAYQFICSRSLFLPEDQHRLTSEDAELHQRKAWSASVGQVRSVGLLANAEEWGCVHSCDPMVLTRVR